MEQIIKNSILKKDKILKLARIVQTPAYIYDLSSIKARVKELINIKYDTKYYAATMSNFNPKLLKLYKKNNLGVFVNSEMHFKLVKKCGFSGRQIIWTSSGMTKDQIIKAYKEKVILNLDSNGQLELYGSLFPNSKVGIRVNIIDMPNNETYAGAFVGPNSRIGILPSEFKETNKIAKKYNLTINGLHVYLGTQKTNLDHFTTGAILLARYLKFFDSLEYIDLGGGFGLPEDEQSFNFKKYNSEISSLMKKISSDYGKHLALILEPGRILAGDSGIFITTITDVKNRNDKDIILVDSSCGQFSQKLIYPDKPNFPHKILDNNNSNKKVADIAGNTTYSRDYLATNTLLPKAKAGQRIVFEYAGSYCKSMETVFLGKEPVKEFFVD